MSQAAFSVNDRPCAVPADERTLLVDYLRDELHLPGTRFGCGQDRCGACVVLVDGQPRASCQIEVGNLRGRSVATVDALTAHADGRLLLAAFEHEQAAQCGFCISGILMRALAFLRDSPTGSREAVAAALAPHLCRCGAHPRILAAVGSAWKARHAGATA